MEDLEHNLLLNMVLVESWLKEELVCNLEKGSGAEAIILRRL
jgi:hypothetical protein